MAKTSAHRFREVDAAWTDRDTVLVRCPHCAHQAVVLREPGWDRVRGGRLLPVARIACSHCGYSHSQSHEGRGSLAPVIAHVRARCSGCGRWLRWTGRRARGPLARVKLQCAGCGATTLVVPKWWPAPAGEARDAYFGLPLWLQTPCCGEVLWAVNPGHLRFLRQYIGAALRERTPNLNRSLASRLPTWMKVAKHRDEVLRGIERLEASLRS